MALDFLQPQSSGDSGSLTPTSISLRRKFLLQQMADALSTKPVQGGMGEALARIGTAGILGYQEGQLDRDEKAQQAAATAAFGAMFGAPGASTPSMAVSDAGTTAPSGVDTVTNTLAGVPKAPSFTGGSQAMAMPADPDIENRFIGQLKAGGLTNPNGLAAMAAYANAESRYSPKNITGSWSDPSESGQAGTSGGILSWRGPRFAAMQQATRGADDPVTAQAKFALTENPDLTVALQNAKTPEEAHSLMANAWRFAGYDRPGGENERRLGLTRQYLGRVGGQGAVQTADAGGAVMSAVSQAPDGSGPFSTPMMPLEGGGGWAPVPPSRPQGVQVASADPSFAPQMPAQPAQGANPAASPAQILVAQQQARQAPQTVPNPVNIGQPTQIAPPAQTGQIAAPPVSATDRITQALSGSPQAQSALRVMQNPYANEGQKSVAKMVLEKALTGDKVQYQTLSDQTIVALDPNGRNAPRPVYQAPTKPTWGVIGQDQFGNSQYGFVDPVRRSVQPYSQPKDPNAPESTVPPAPPGVNPQIWNKAQSESAASQAVPADPKAVAELRKEIFGTTEYKNYSQAAPIYQAMSEAAGRNSKASDLNLVYGLGKIMDPTSVVREGEMVMVKNTAALPEWLQGQIAKLNGGGELTPETRKAIMQEAHGRMQAYEGQYSAVSSHYQGIAQRNRMPVQDVVPGFTPSKPWELPAPAKPATPAQDWQEVAPGVRIRPKAGGR